MMNESEEAIKILKDFLENPDNYFAKKYPHVPLAFYDSVEVAIKMMEKSQLNENQQQVFGWLKLAVEDRGSSPMDAVYLLILGEALTSVSLAYIALSDKEQAQVLKVFSKWALEQEEE